jgi:hypothetical protein
MSAGSRFAPGTRVRVVNPDYGTFERTGTVTEPDDFWTFGPCVLLDGQHEAGAFLDSDLESAPLEFTSEELRGDDASRPSPARAVARIPASIPVGSTEAAEAASNATYHDGLAEGWSQAIRHVAHRLGVEGGARANTASIAPELAGLLAGIVARVESAETKALAARTARERRESRERRTTLLPPEPAIDPGQGLSARTLTMLIQAVSEIVIQERDRARAKWGDRVRDAEAREAAERGRRQAAEAALAETRRRAAAEPPAALRDNALMEVLTCAEEFISGAALNRALVLRALRETLGNLRQVSEVDAMRGEGPKRLR